MDALIYPLLFVRCYLDDLLVASATPEQHRQHLRQLFTTLRQARLSINMNFWDSSYPGPDTSHRRAR